MLILQCQSEANPRGVLKPPSQRMDDYRLSCGTLCTGSCYSIEARIRLTLIQTDDVGVFCSQLSNEYLLAAKHFGLDRSDLLKMCRKAIDVMFGGEEEKERLRIALSIFERASGHSHT